MPDILLYQLHVMGRAVENRDYNSDSWTPWIPCMSNYINFFLKHFIKHSLKVKRKIFLVRWQALFEGESTVAINAIPSKIYSTEVMAHSYAYIEEM